MNSGELLLSTCMSVDYPGKPGVLHNASLQMRNGEVLGLVGQSGAGKSTIALSIMRLLDLRGGKVAGSVCFRGRDLLRMREREIRLLRGCEIALVQQSPIASLNPAMRIRTQLAEAWRAHVRGTSDLCQQAILDAVRSVSLPADETFLRCYPAQLSVGQAQRVLIAMALIHHPALLIADEPTSALDVITQAEILALFRDLNRRCGVGILYISHDLASVASICDRIAILHEGEVVECGDTEEIFCRPSHSYTQRLILAQPQISFRRPVSAT